MKRSYRHTVPLAAFALSVLAALPHPAAAQLRQPAPWAAESAPAAMLPATPTEPDGRSSGFPGAVVGAAVGTAIALPFFVAAAGRDGSCHPRGAVLGCYTSMAPLALGAGLGAATGSAAGGGRAAFMRTMLGSVVGAVVGAGVILGDSAPVGGGSVLFGVVAPAAGALIGNRVGQRR